MSVISHRKRPQSCQSYHIGNDPFLIPVSHVTQEWVMSHMTESRHRAAMHAVTRSYVIWLIPMWYNSVLCDVNHAYDIGMSHAMHRYTHDYPITWLIHMWHDSFLCNTTHSYDIGMSHTMHGYTHCCSVTLGKGASSGADHYFWYKTPFWSDSVPFRFWSDSDQNMIWSESDQRP